MTDPFEYADEFGPAKIVHVHEPHVGLRGILVVDNTAAGPAIGGLRMAADASLSECFRLARAMSFKNAAAGLAHSRAYFTEEARFAALRDNSKVIGLETGTAVVGVLAGTPHAAYLEAHIVDSARIRRFPDEEELYLSLLGGSIDAVFADGLTLYDALIEHPAELPVVFAGPAIDDPVFFDPAIVFALAPGDPLVAEIDRALVTLAGDGTLRLIIETRLPGYAGGNPTGP